MAEQESAATPEAVLPEIGKPGMLAPLRVSAFRFLLTENFFSQIGQTARLMAQAWLVLELTDSDAWVGAVNGLPAIPIAMLTLLGGTVVDRYNRRRILLVTRLTIAALGLLAAFLIATDAIRLWHLLILTMGFAFSHSLGTIASQTILVDVVGRPQLLRANAMYSVTLNTAAFAGPAAGGILVASMGVNGAFLLLAAAAMLAAGVASLLRFTQPTRPDNGLSLLADVAEGAKYVWRTPVLRWLLFVSLFVMFVGAYQVTLPRIARDELGLDAAGYGAILAASGLGALAGAITMILAGGVRALALILLGVGFAFSLLVLGFALAQTREVAMVVSFCIGFVFPWWGNVIRTAFQTAVRDDMRGRAASLFALAAQMIPLGWLLGGALSDAFGPRAALVISAAAVASAYSVAYARSSELRQLGRG